MHPGVATAVVSGGVATVTIEHNKANLFWRLHQIAIDVNGDIATIRVLFNGLPCMSRKTVLTPIAASGVPSIDIGSHDKLSFMISEANDGDNVIVTYYYEEIQGTP